MLVKQHFDIPISDREILRVCREDFAADMHISVRSIVRYGSGTRPSRNGLSLTLNQARALQRALDLVLPPEERPIYVKP